MSWEKLGDGRFERPLGETEKLVWLIGASTLAAGRDEWHLFTTARIRFGSEQSLGDEAVAALSKAWKSLRFDHPSIAVITDGVKLTYQVSDTDSLEDWTEKTFIVEREASEPEDIIACVEPCEQLQLHVLPHAGQIVLHTAHWRSDGRGLPQLLDRLLYILTHPESGSLQWGEEVSRLTISLEDAADMANQVSPADQVRVQEMATRLLKGSPALTISSLGDPETQPGPPRRCLLTLSAPETATLVSSCKARSLTVTAAVHAAIATVNIAHATPNSQTLDYRSSIRRDLRSRLRAPHNTPFSAAALYNTATIISLPAASATWSDLAKRLTDEYRDNYDDELFRLHRVYYRQLVADITRAAIEGGGTARAADVDISSIGLVENLVCRDYGELRSSAMGMVQVEEVRVSVNTCSRQAAVFVFTFRDRLNLYMTYNEAFHAKGDMEGFLSEVKGTLVAQLGI